jgi:hypothetical protein
MNTDSEYYKNVHGPSIELQTIRKSLDLVEADRQNVAEAGVVRVPSLGGLNFPV